MNDLISRQAAIDALKRAEALTRAFGYHFVIDTIRELPAAQPEREKGKWIADNHDFWVCSNCKFPSEAHGANILYKFCPNCGADMRGEQDERLNQQTGGD